MQGYILTTQGLKRTTSEGSWFSADGTLISASTLPHDTHTGKKGDDSGKIKLNGDRRNEYGRIPAAV